nr:type IV pilus secretin PilQ [Methylomarinum sp. Ch1-1]MDP4522128.1 type IV pilus secretin PilQ [Methylomarinum sp. Ch1-1]
MNLLEAVDYETKIVDNKLLLVLNAAKSVAASNNVVKKQLKQSSVSKLIPQQLIKGVDFRRGPQGEGRLMLSLSNPNTVVDVKERGGKVILNFLNTKIPDALAKSYDVTDFATPVQRVDASPRGNGVNVTVSTIDANYDYSSFQSEGLLTVEFTPLSVEEKAAKLKEKFPYSGDKLSLNFQDIEVRSVLQILADFTELNIIASDSVGGSVTLRLNDVPWDQALALVLKSKGLAKRESGNVIFVAPATEITKMEEEELAAKKVVQKLEPLVTEYIQINYAKAEDFRNMLLSRGQTGQGGRSGMGSVAQSAPLSSGGVRGIDQDELRLVSRRGTVIVDPRTNTLIVRDTAKQLEEIRKLINLLDIPVRQVLIESRIVIADKNFAQELGVKFGVAKMASIGSGKTFAIGGSGTASNSNAQADDEGNIGTINDTLVDLGAQAIASHPAGALGMTLARAADYVLNLELSALENENRGEILSNPRIMTTDRVKAVIKQGIQKQITTPGSANNPPTQAFVDVVLELEVTPQITPNGEVIMDLLIKKDNEIPNSVDFANREITTTVQVKDGETIVVGGVYEEDSGKNVFRVPFFSDLPGVGFLFRKNIESDVKRELLMFITPKIIKSTLSVD